MGATTLSGGDVLIICAGILITMAATAFVLSLLFDDKK
ncbi:hypothetical protein MOC16_gp292 [Klebsiella phage vB_KpM_FBKp24]|uniref:Holin-like toxin n=1 Tax=Klebsiella phage vB_KpM_FBKp24 TaxID=2801834 RepID=A0A7U0GBZ4_9CAUD|nr:hypothetical protein MOC16_gp292 [Klebsiella phage vB_KpM_FBKp24]QQV92362.1 hypothetical protein vBKpMFBKp24_121 [Klebsiella phage vB_KpM_FBKp24]